MSGKPLNKTILQESLDAVARHELARDYLTYLRTN